MSDTTRATEPAAAGADAGGFARDHRAGALRPLAHLARHLHTAATVVALVGLVVVMAVAAFVASRRQVSGASVIWMVSAIAGVIIAVGGSPSWRLRSSRSEPQTVTRRRVQRQRRRLHADALEVGRRLADRDGVRQPGTGRPAQRRDLRREDAEAPQLFSGTLITGPAIDYAVARLPEGSYFFHCEIHPTTMAGEIASVPGPRREKASGGGAAGDGTPIVAQALEFNTVGDRAARRSALAPDLRQPGSGVAPQRRDLRGREPRRGPVPGRDHHRPDHDRLRDAGDRGGRVLLPVRHPSRHDDRDGRGGTRVRAVRGWWSATVAAATAAAAAATLPASRVAA